jgi:HEPN domain-containing protein
MNRAELRNLAKLRLAEAQTLLAAARWSGAYYLSGYSVECALKACIAKNTRRSEFPDKGLAQSAHTHDLARLVKVAGLEVDLRNASAADAALDVNWATVKDWNSESRYRVASQLTASDMIDGISDPDHGVLKWLRLHW